MLALRSCFVRECFRCVGFRERCDSMPSRPRTTSEGNHANPNWKPYAVPFRGHLRDASHSPPAGKCFVAFNTRSTNNEIKTYQATLLVLHRSLLGHPTVWQMITTPFMRWNIQECTPA